jgi:hypothetical protein
MKIASARQIGVRFFITLAKSLWFFPAERKTKSKKEERYKL